jgi:hypothetical protein
LFLTLFGITIFYAIDISQVAEDANMHQYWQHLLGTTAPIYLLPEHFFHFLAQPGSGFVFWWIFGLLGVTSIVVVFRKTIHHFRIRLMLTEHYLNLYAILTLLLVIFLNVVGKLPLGEPRLNAFGIPAIALIVVSMLQQTAEMYAKQTTLATCILLSGLTGNIYTTIAATLTGETYHKRMAIYRATEDAILLAAKEKLPILVTPGVAWPYNGTKNYPFDEDVPGDWVLMCWPAYSTQNATAVYAIPDMKMLPEFLGRLPTDVHKVVAGDGLAYIVTETQNQ